VANTFTAIRARATVVGAITMLGALATLACRGSDRRTEPASLSATPGRGGELVASIRSDPSSYNRYVAAGASATSELVMLLTQARLVRVNRASDELEPWLAESWTQSDDGLTYTIKLRQGIRFSDGQPFSSADVLFSFRAVYDPAVNSPLRSALTIHGKPLDVSAPDPHTVVVRLPEAFAPGLRLLDNLPVLPKHKLEAALAAGQFAQEWSPAKPLSDVVGLGPFVLSEHVAGQRLVLIPNAHYFRRDDSGVQLPYVDRLTLTVVPDQNTEALRLEAAETDLMSNGDIRPQDHAAFKRLADQGRLALIDGGVGLDPDFLSFNLRPAGPADRRPPWLAQREFRQAISCGVDRQAIINAVYLGAAVPIYGPITPGNRKWHTPGEPACAFDRDRARKLLAAAGLTDRNGDGLLEDTRNRSARFSIITQAGHLRERVSSVIQEQLRQLGITVDIVALDPGGIFQRWQKGEYEAIYFGLQASSTDPALNPEFWLSSGTFHFWNPGQPRPATEWERRIDELMREQSTSPDLTRRQRAFGEVQAILGEELPSIYFVAPRVTLATTQKVRNATPAPQIPQLLWNADSLAVAR
jgi:peptide/nickel transport system substrate-binding protein